MDDIWIISFVNHTACDANPIWKPPTLLNGSSFIFSHRSLGIPRNFRDFPVFFWYFLDFLSNIKVFGQNNLIFELLQQK